jgi:hypothetical protein
MKRGMSGHHSARMVSDTWITPKHIIDALGPFDLDPCTPDIMPWDTAKKRYTKVQDGLKQPWDGFVWLNPPYGRLQDEWLKKMVEHNNGIALIFARTETKCWFDHVWDRASCILFLRGRLTFHKVSGEKGAGNSGAPSALVGYGGVALSRIRDCGLSGCLIEV